MSPLAAARLLAVALAVAAVAAAPHPCVTFMQSFTPCTSYATGHGPSVPVPVPCCDGVKSMAGMMTTRADRVAACTCFQAAAAKMQGIDYGRVTTLPGHCNVDATFDFTPDVHCDTIKAAAVGTGAEEEQHL
ncbi:non-specific lipid-transfer protein P5-like [Zingiber officinale]|uniref:non-specific lipid-transfer protein P5-like n=1 Tax=Zingiber officinale TaxID=94328 RepID=UPI001C4D5906|nr:non-specific lipid-transfer protein P5-like [Zingiber officinale]